MGIIITSPSPSHRQVNIATRVGFEPTAPWLEWRALYLSHAAYILQATYINAFLFENPNS